jgi:hypothetical protein
MARPMTFPVDVVLRGQDVAVTESASVSGDTPFQWDDRSVRDVLVAILRAIDRVQHPDAPADRLVALRGFSWIVQPTSGKEGVVIAIEIPMGAAVAGPFDVDADRLDELIGRVLRAEVRADRRETVH